MENLEGRVAVVTGGASGIGRSLAERLRSEGSEVVIADRSIRRLDEARSAGFRAYNVDVTDIAAMEDLAGKVLGEFGKVDLLFNNAGVGLQQSFANMSLSDWRWVLDVNFWGVVNGLEAFLPHLRGNPDGAHVVNTSSLLGLMTMPGIAAYAASKYAVIGLTLTLQQEEAVLGSNVGVTVFCPGPVESNIQESLEERDARYGAPQTDTSPPGPVEQTFFQAGAIPGTLTAEQGAAVAIEAVKTGEFWAVTHPELIGGAQANYESLMAAVNR